MVVGKDKPITIERLITVCGFAITICTIVWGASTISGNVEGNCKEISRVDVDGCKPSVEVRRDMVGTQKDIERNSLDIRRVEGKLDKMIERQDTVIERQGTVISLLKEMAK